jgi:NDP-sugar pyrophosphorylase family protein
MQILLPMAGGRAHFSESDFFFPKPLVEVAGRPMIQRAVERLQRDFDSPDFIYVIDHEDAARFSLDSTLQFLSQGHCKIKKLQTKTQGALCTCLMAVDLLDLDEPLLIVNYDQVIDADLSGIVQRFQSEQAVAGVVTFDSIHPRWSYVRRDAQGQVVEAAEKRVISRDAIAGVYYFDTASRFVEIAKQTILNGDEVDGKYYIAPALNRLVVQNLSIAVQEISSKDYHTFYTPANVEAYAASVGKDGDVTDAQNIRSERLTVVIPAAGEGSRFSKAEWRKPKPFIDVGGKPMITRVIENVTPDGAVPTVLLRSQSIES